ncbi:MAG: putative DNA binding domain-containing protein [Bacilli bacterium]|nr:putative DNA binding domain-containing protein [Bacilli bacterium]
MNLGIEDETIEFKTSTGELNEAMNSISAMLNKHGKGTIYFGVLPNGEVRGQTVTESTLRDVSRKIYECIDPRITPTIEKKDFDGKQTIEVTFSGNNRPYSNKGIFYIRSADEDRILPVAELRQLFEYNKDKSWDKEIIEYTIDDISIESLETFYKRATACGRLKEHSFNPLSILKKIGLMNGDKLTNAAYYLFSKNKPIVLKMAVFATDEKLTFIDINRTKGNIIELIDEACGYIKKNIHWKGEIIDFKREEIPEIPLKAIREIVCNCFAHARYNSNTEHEISIHPSKIVIYNPGEFPIGYKPEDFVKEDIQSIVRNPLILDTLYLSDDVESYGSGFKRVYSECKLNNVSTDYNISKDGFSFIFKRQFVTNVINDVLNMSQIEKEIIDVLKNNPETTIEQLSDMVKKSPRTVQRTLNDLKDKGKIDRVGKTKGYWLVK